MTKLRTTLMAATMLAAVPLVANAQPVSGLYIAAGAGMNFMQDVNVSANGRIFDNSDNAASRNGRGSANFGFRQPGFVGLGSLGWGFGNGLRAEVEGNYRNNAVTSGSGSGYFGGEGGMFGGEGSVGGQINTYGIMANLLYDFNGLSSFVVPYIGAGVGYAWRDASNLRGCYNGGCLSADGNGGNFAYQAIAGAAFPIAAVPGLALTLEYRYFGVLDTSHSGTRNRYYSSTYGNVNVDNTSTHNVLLGFRYAFNAAPAAVMAAPAPVAPAAKSFLVFFDWDKYNLTDRARTIIREAAATSKTVAHTVIEVNGFADTSGTPKYNLGLGMRRAQTVAAEMVRNGVPKNVIAIKSFGDTVLLVPTGPGVREPQNRRVEIIIR